MLIQGHEICTIKSSYAGLPPPNLVFLAFLGAEIAWGHYMPPPPPGRIILRPFPARVLKRFRLAHKRMRLLNRQIPKVNPRPAGPLDFPPPAGGDETPPLSRLLGHVATRGKRQSKERQQIMTKLHRSFSRSGQRSGHQRSPKVKFCRFQHFSTNWHITREPEELQRCEKAHSIALLTFFRCYVFRFDLRSTVWSSESKN